MKILIHLNHGSKKSYQLTFENGITPKDVRQILQGGHDNAIRALLIKSKKKTEIPPKDRLRAECLADFTISQQGYSAERLA